MAGLFKRKKKDLTPEQYRVRFYVAGGLVLAMLVVCLLPRKKVPFGPPPGTPAAVMEQTVDSLLLDMYGEGVVLDGADFVERYVVQADESRRMDDLKAELEMLSALSQSGAGIPDGRADRIREEMTEVGRMLADMKDDTVFVRRIRATLPDGTKVTGFQKLDVTLRQASLESMVPLQPDQAVASQIEKALKENQYE